MSKRTVARAAIASGFVIAVVGWYVFRPELLFISRPISEEFPAAMETQSNGAGPPPAALSTGRFRSVAHETKGVATVYRLADGKRVLRFTDFETSNGPDVLVYLVAAADASDTETVKKAGFVSLGALKGTVGDQNYEIPADVDLTTYRSVAVWCRRFGVNFGAAPLTAQRG